jgi:DNA-directed RNA polymerase subunit RPC12/RpoP
MKIEQSCPTCGSHDIMKNGTTRRGKQNYKCKDCGRQFVEDPQWKPKDRDIAVDRNLRTFGFDKTVPDSYPLCPNRSGDCYIV